MYFLHENEYRNHHKTGTKVERRKIEEVNQFGL
jgi:hypothetical protein